MCTRCGRVSFDPPSEPFAVQTIEVPKSVEDAVRRVGSFLDATHHVRSTAEELVVRVGGRSSNVNLVAATLYVAFRRHNLDRLEDEITSRVPGVTRRLFAKHLNRLRRHGLDHDHDVDVGPILRRTLSTEDRTWSISSRRLVATRVRRVQKTYDTLRRVHGDTKTVSTLVRMALAHHHEHAQRDEQTAAQHGDGNQARHQRIDHIFGRLLSENPT